MKMIVTEDYEEMSLVASHHVLEKAISRRRGGESGGDGGEHAKADV